MVCENQLRGIIMIQTQCGRALSRSGTGTGAGYLDLCNLLIRRFAGDGDLCGKGPDLTGPVY